MANIILVVVVQNDTDFKAIITYYFIYIFFFEITSVPPQQATAIKRNGIFKTMTYYVHIITVSYTVISDMITSKATGETITRIKLSLLQEHCY